MNATVISIISIALIFVGTTLGSALVFFFKNGNLSDKVSNSILGFASGVMFAAAIFGLLLPSIEESQNSEIYSSWAFVPPIVGFVAGCLFLYLLDKIIPHLHRNEEKEEGLPSSKINKNGKLFLAIAIHNIPEGLAVGFACGLALSTSSEANILACLTLAIGIAIQNIPEGSAVSIPYLADGYSKGKSFLFGTLTGLIEPIFAVIGLFLATYIQGAMPWLLAFSSGAMIYVTIDELLPEARKGDYIHYGIWAFIIGFVIMLALEIAL